MVKAVSKMRMIGCLFCFACCSSAYGAQTNLPFSGTLLGVCILGVSTPGTLASNSNYTVIGSNQTGGISGIVTALTTAGGYSISVTAPSSFNSAPSGGGANVTFSASFTATGLTIIPQTLAGVQVPLNVGLTTATVDMTATKSTGSFVAGVYSATVVVTCE